MNLWRIWLWLKTFPHWFLWFKFQISSKRWVFLKAFLHLLYIFRIFFLSWIFWCQEIFEFRLKAFPHWLHTKSFSSVWTFLCLLRFELLLKIFWHLLHFQGLVWIFLYWLRSEQSQKSLFAFITFKGPLFRTKLSMLNKVWVMSKGFFTNITSVGSLSSLSSLVLSYFWEADEGLFTVTT